VRRDIPPPLGYKDPFDYKPQTGMLDFFNFMMDRQAVESFRTQITLKVGEVQEDHPQLEALNSELPLPRKSRIKIFYLQSILDAGSLRFDS